MQTTLTLPDKKADKYVKGRSSDVCENQSSTEDEEDFYQTAEEFYEELREAISEVKDDIAGRKQLKTIEELLIELRSED